MANGANSNVVLACQLNKPYLPVLNTPQLAYVLVEALPGQSMTQVRMPLNFALVLDRSGSMAGEKIKHLREAAKIAVQQMDASDYIAVALFNDKAKRLVESQQIGANQKELVNKVEQISSGGGTAISKGLDIAIKEIDKQVATERVSRILLLTDGQTYGDEKKCVELAKDLGKKGIPINALGLGEDWNEDLLDNMAQHSGGTSDYLASPTEIEQYFQNTVQSMQATVIKNAQLILRFMAGITPRQVWQVIPMISNLGYQPLSERDVQVELGELEKDQGKQLLIEVVIPPRPTGKFRVAQAEVSYDIPSKGITDEKVRSDIVVEFTADASQSKQYNPEMMNLVEKVTAFKLQTRALEEARMGNIDGATQKLRSAATRLLDMGEVELAEAAQQEAENLEKQGAMSAGGTKKLRYATRKLTQRLPEKPAD